MFGVLLFIAFLWIVIFNPHAIYYLFIVLLSVASMVIAVYFLIRIKEAVIKWFSKTETPYWKK